MQYFNEIFSDEMHKFHCCRECADWSPGCQRARQVHAGDLDDAPEGDSGEHACGQRDCGNCKRVGNPELGQQGRKRPEATQAIERQDALLMPRHCHPFLRAFEQGAQLYSGGISVHFDEKGPRIGRIRGPGSSLCTLSGNVAAVGAGGHAACHALLGLSRLLAADDLVKPPRNPRRILARLGPCRTATPHRTQSRTSAHLQTRPHSQNKPDASEHP